MGGDWKGESIGAGDLGTSAAYSYECRINAISARGETHLGTLHTQHGRIVILHIASRVIQRRGTGAATPRGALKTRHRGGHRDAHKPMLGKISTRHELKLFMHGNPWFCIVVGRLRPGPSPSIAHKDDDLCNHDHKRQPLGNDRLTAETLNVGKSRMTRVNSPRSICTRCASPTQ